MNRFKRFNKSLIIVVLILICLSPFSYVSSAQDASLSARIDHLEALVSTQQSLILLSRLRSLQQEVQQLRTLLEEQTHTISTLKQQQGVFYSELNQRFNQLEDLDTVSIHKPQIKNDSPMLEMSIESNIENVAKKPALVMIKPMIKAMSATEYKAEKKAYQLAYNKLQSHQYHQARELFVSFIKKYPTGQYAHIAQYWMAEMSYTQHSYKQAIIDYQRLLDVYPLSPKKAEAELKKAYSFYELEDKKHAKNILNQLLISYPKTTEANQAKRLLKKM